MKKISLISTLKKTFKTKKVSKKKKIKTISKPKKIKNVVKVKKPKTVDKNIAKQLQQARCAKKLKQKEVAQRLNVPLSMIQNVENGKAKLNKAFISRLKKFYGINSGNYGFLINIIGFKLLIRI